MDFDLQDDSFADSDLDDLPDHALDELEKLAVLSTQQPSRGITRNGRVNGKLPSTNLEPDEGAGEVINLNSPLPIPTRKRLDDVTQREQWRLNRYGAGSNSVSHSQRIQADKSSTRLNTLQQQQQQQPPHSSRAQNISDTQNLSQYHNSQNIPFRQDVPGQRSATQGDDLEKVDRLLARIRQLEQERVSLKSQTEEANSAVLSRAGEIAIVRANHDKATKEFERRMAIMQKMHAEELSKQKLELEIARKERAKIEINNRFLEHDLAQETEKARNLRKSLKDGTGNGSKPAKSVPLGASPLSTPRKATTYSMRDGFNDDEVVLISPSKAGDRHAKGLGTPRAGVKRKRVSANEKFNSPGPANPAPSNLDQSDSFQIPDTTTPPSFAARKASTNNYAKDSDEKFEFLKLIFNHRHTLQHTRSIEALSKYSFTDKPLESLSSYIYQQLSYASSEETIEQCRIRFCNTVLNLWSRCLKETFHEPLYDLAELLQYTLIVSPSELTIPLAVKAVKLSAQTADLIAFPRAKASNRQNVNAATAMKESDVQESLEKLIKPWDYLEILYLIALNCSLHPASKAIQTFWSTMEFDFVLTMLHRAQPLNQIVLMLHLLGTSALTSSFGAIYRDPSTPQQRKYESDLVDRLTVLLFETSISGSSESSLLDLRYSVLSLLRNICTTPHGGALLASHRLVIGRLVRFLHDAVLLMYSSALQPCLSYPDPEEPQQQPRQHDQSERGRISAATLVNQTVLILSHLTTVHSSKIKDIRTKLATVPSGQQKYLVALSRVAFAEGLTDLESGIDAEASETAHGMLDELLSPEEGEEVVKVFSSGFVSGIYGAANTTSTATDERSHRTPQPMLEDGEEA